MAQKIAENLYRFCINLKDNPLKYLNCYVIKDPNGRNLLIDTGFRTHECREDLLSGINELELDPNETDVFITHYHADHTGNASYLAGMGCTIYMNELEYYNFNNNYWPNNREWILKEGMPEDVLSEIFKANPAVKMNSDYFEAVLLKDGDVINRGGYSLRCMVMPGHTPGHTCLYEDEKKILFAGDHVLFDISPNICTRGAGSNALGDYLCSLKKIRNLPVELVLPGHRSFDKNSLADRVDHLLAHHEKRLSEIERLLAEYPGITAYDLTGHITWKIRARNWDDFPVTQKWFATSEALAHLDLLCSMNKVSRVWDESGVYRYYLISPIDKNL